MYFFSVDSGIKGRTASLTEQLSQVSHLNFGLWESSLHYQIEATNFWGALSAVNNLQEDLCLYDNVSVAYQLHLGRGNQLNVKYIISSNYGMLHKS